MFRAITSITVQFDAACDLLREVLAQNPNLHGVGRFWRCA